MIPDHVLSAWLVFFAYQDNGAAVVIPGSVIEAFKDRGWMIPHREEWQESAINADGHWQLQLTDAGRARVDLDKADWHANIRYEKQGEAPDRNSDTWP